MVAQLGEPENYSVCSKMHEVWAVKMMCDANATPGIVNCPLAEYWISSRGLSFVRRLVVLQDAGWAILWSLTNKTHKLNQEIAGTRVYVSILPAYTFCLFPPILYTPTASWLRHHVTCTTQCLSFQNTPDNLTTLYFPSGLPSATCNCIIMLTLRM